MEDDNLRFEFGSGGFCEEYLYLILRAHVFLHGYVGKNYHLLFSAWQAHMNFAIAERQKGATVSTN